MYFKCIYDCLDDRNKKITKTIINYKILDIDDESYLKLKTPA